MNTPTNNTVASLTALSLVTITNISNHLANLISVKPTKRFATKTAAINKCLANQTEFNIQFPAKKVEEKVAPKSSFDLTAILTYTGNKPKENTLEACIEFGLREITSEWGAEQCTVEYVAEYIIAQYSRPRSEKNVDEAFAIRKIKRLIKKGNLTITK